MKLNVNDIAILKQMGYLDDDIRQIEKVSGVIYLSLFSSEEATVGKRIGADRAQELLGKMDFFSGLGRAAFHWNCARDIQDPEKKGLDKGAYVVFNARPFFKRKMKKN